MTASNDDGIERLVLMNAWEDYAMLWQVAGEVRDTTPGGSDETARRAARRAVRSLLERGLIEVFRRESRRDEFKLLTGPARDAALDGDDYWRADPRETAEVAVAATAAGEEEYLRRRAPAA